ncbi:MAG: hypothetical protein F9B45_31365 [Phycisphaera sp. RhM]|nr:hypothetical protein [Phycisphaera sp. RhM]
MVEKPAAVDISLDRTGFADVRQLWLLAFLPRIFLHHLPLAWAVRGKSGYGFSGFEGFRFLQPFATTSLVIAELPKSEEVTAGNGENASFRPFFMCFVC